MTKNDQQEKGRILHSLGYAIRSPGARYILNTRPSNNRTTATKADVELHAYLTYTICNLLQFHGMFIRIHSNSLSILYLPPEHYNKMSIEGQRSLKVIFGRGFENDPGIYALQAKSQYIIPLSTKDMEHLKKLFIVRKRQDYLQYVKDNLDKLQTYNSPKIEYAECAQGKDAECLSKNTKLTTKEFLEKTDFFASRYNKLEGTISTNYPLPIEQV